MFTSDAANTGFSVVVEMENAATVCWHDVGQTLHVLTEQILALHVPLQNKPQVILAHPGEEHESAGLIEAARREAPGLSEAARVQAVSVSGGRYYELKNAGISRSDGELIVLLDSDAVPEPGWLAALLAPFHDPKTIVVHGCTYLGHFDLVSRTLAMIWVFPLRDHDEREVKRRSLNANNCAFRAKTLGLNPFPIDNGFKVGCTKFMKQLQECGIELVRVAAYVKHAPLTGFRFLVWRGLVTGRDADRKVADLKSRSRWRRFRSALSFWLKMEFRVVRRVLTHYHHVALPFWQVPVAIALGLSFFGFALVGQVSRLLGLTAERPEYIPAYAEHH